jgi:hypothetical protein
VRKIGLIVIATTLLFPAFKSSAADTSTATKSQYESALTALNKLPVKGRAPKTGYTREQFPHWKDPDKNGCDSRNDILKRDLSKVIFKADTNNCKVIAGTLLDPYSNKLIEFDDNGNRIVYKQKNVLLQKWNNVIINYNGGILDIFLNGELVKSNVEVVPYYTLDNLTVGEDNGINGSICNLVYFNKPSIYSLS